MPELPAYTSQREGNAESVKGSTNHVEESASLAFEACGRRWVLYRPADLETMWERLDSEEFLADERLPYWVVLWPSSLVLADWLVEHASSITGKICLDLGCGLGLTAMVGAIAGGKVLGLDYEKQALFYAMKNATVNESPPVVWAAMDWRVPAVLPKTASFIWAGDIVYEKRFVEPVLHFLEYALADDGVVWISEPGRTIYNLFAEAVAASTLTAACVKSTTVQALEGHTVPVNIWEITRKK